MLKKQSMSPSRGTVQAVKSISFTYVSSQQLSSLFEDFRLMCNDAIRIANKEKPRNRFNLIELAYARLKQYGLHTHYILSACEVAYSVYSNKRRKCVPYIKRAFLKLDNQSYQLNHLLSRIPTNPRNFVFLALQGSDYHMSFVDDPNLKKGSVTITERSVCISFTREVPALEHFGCMGIDINERNITVSTTNGFEHKFAELGEVVEIKERYREIMAKISKNTRGDGRICKKLLTKYGKREERRTTQRIHKPTNEIVSYARANRLGIKMERLKGIRKLYRKGNGQTKSFRGRMNSWVFGETQRQVDHKARWEGVPDWFVNPRGSSSNCPDCGSRVVRLADRKVYCPACDRTWDRDVLASRNIMACVVPQARPSKGSNEVERGDDDSNPLNRWGEGSVAVDNNRQGTGT